MSNFVVALLAAIAMLVGGCTSTLRLHDDDHVNVFLNELMNMSIAHFYQEQDFYDVIADLKARTGLDIVLKIKTTKPMIITFRATNMLSTLDMMALVANGTWGFKGRTIYIGHDLPALDYRPVVF